MGTWCSPLAARDCLPLDRFWRSWYHPQQQETLPCVSESKLYAKTGLRPIAGLPSHLHEHQRLTITIEDMATNVGWLADADPSASLESVRAALGKSLGTLTQMVHAEREER
jgi:hypothetical protein